MVTNTAQNGRSSKSFRDEGHWATALAAKGDYYLIQFGHNDQPGKGPERETDPATTFPANMARYVDEVRAIGATPILVTSLVRRTFSETEPAKLTSTLGPWVEAVKRVAAEKRVPLIDLDASSRALCERLGPAETRALQSADRRRHVGHHPPRRDRQPGLCDARRRGPAPRGAGARALADRRSRG